MLTTCDFSSVHPSLNDSLAMPALYISSLKLTLDELSFLDFQHVALRCITTLPVDYSPRPHVADGLLPHVSPDIGYMLMLYTIINAFRDFFLRLRTSGHAC